MRTTSSGTHLTAHDRTRTRRRIIRRSSRLGAAFSLALVLVAGGTVGSPATTQAAGDDLPRLSEAARERGVLFGAGSVNPAFLDDPDFARILPQQFDSLSPENELKWSFVQPRRGEFNFTGLDRLVRFAKKHDMQVKGHGLFSACCDAPYAAKVTNPKRLLRLVREHVRGVMRHFRGKMDRWDVMTEALTTFGGQGLAPIHLRNVLGPNYVAKLFRIAHRADPSVRLFYNENLVEFYPAKRQEMYELITGMLDKGVPIDGIGLQSHNVMQGPPAGELAAIIDEYQALGLEVAITELDVHTYDTAQQSQIYHQVVTEALAAGVDEISLWGFTDKYGYALFPQPGTPPPVGTQPNILDAEYQPKPAFYGTLHALRGEPCGVPEQLDCYVGETPAEPLAAGSP